MKNVIELPQELDWVIDELQTALEKGYSEMTAGGRPEWSNGYLQAAREITEGLENKYQTMLEARRQVIRSREVPVA